jgi:hypothetical protein
VEERDHIEVAPIVAFIVIGLLMSFAERSYFEAVTATDQRVRRDVDVAAQLTAHLLTLPQVVAVQTRDRLRSLATRQADPAVERRRWLALATIAAAAIAFAWVLSDWLL